MSYRKIAIISPFHRKNLRLSACLYGLSQPDWAVVESATVVGTQRSPLRHLGPGVPSHWGRYGVLERLSASLCLGPASPASAASADRHRCGAKSSI